jgi:protein-tyrosine phosphatase
MHAHLDDLNSGAGKVAFARDIVVPGLFNLRDLGGYPHPGGATPWRRILRADGMYRCDAESIAALKRLGVATVIDLRHDEELARQPNPLRNEPGIVYRHVSLFAGLAPVAMVDGDVLHALYREALTDRGGAIIEILTVIAEAPDGAVLFHCTAGKDRTGLVAALLLALVGVEAAMVVDDYALTGERIAPLVEEFLADAVSRGHTADRFRPLLACEPRTMAATLAHLVEAHGSVEGYLLGIGLEPAVIARLKARLSEAA